MDAHIKEAAMEHSKEDGYLGRVIFQWQEKPTHYELTLQSKNSRDWNYSLSFAGESGSEEDFYAVEARLEEDDELFDSLVDAAMEQLEAAEAEGK
ncbi:hypothetical protein SAMN02799630_02531 [Paenibacillus sp. UNCCL117]|uniref:hypothetical protein n=1 Tax=unclassified Paenibacillus TaxID=185978 RepID=UPI000884B5BD|nr:MULTISPECIES: hypothetical protein [unclassified Paenibacillus]SDC04806.1 hypothetical protein SAMN04488602_101200 [Paenibacillus sp. cl123]SFW37418.1 hypothetical protein SAMN02799630_02531 [Paenibacillus sp. UNCCL117]